MLSPLQMFIGPLKHLLLLLFALGVRCSSTAHTGRMEHVAPAANRPSADPLPLHALKKLFVVGDFTGSGHQDTLFQHTFSKRYGREIEQAADPFQVDWDLVQNWFYVQEADVFLAFSRSGRDTHRQ